MTVRPWKAKGLAQETEGAYNSTAAGGGFWVLPASRAGYIVLTLQLACGPHKLEALPSVVIRVFDVSS